MRQFKLRSTPPGANPWEFDMNHACLARYLTLDKKLVSSDKQRRYIKHILQYTAHETYYQLIVCVTLLVFMSCQQCRTWK